MISRYVRNALQTYENSRTMFSLNLPYQYEDGKENSNQIDGIVINEKGIFVLEIKNYTADKIWINRDGYAVTEKKGGKQMVYKGYHDRGIVDQGQDHYEAVRQALKATGLSRRRISYLERQLHVLYVSTDPNTQVVTTGADVDPDHRFVSLDNLSKVIDGANGNLWPNIVQQVAATMSSQQKGEKQFNYKCFPADPDRRARQIWQQYSIMQEMLDLSMDDLVAQRDPNILDALKRVDLKSCDGFVNKRNHYKKKS